MNVGRGAEGMDRWESGSGFGEGEVDGVDIEG